MRKEILFAILAGVVVGVVIAFGVWRANRALKVKDNEVSSTEIAPDLVPQQQEFGITLARPEAFDVITQTPVTLSGITKPKLWVAVSGEDEDYITKSDESGAFEINVELAGGVNQILIVAFDDNGNSIKESLTVVYSTEFAKEAGEKSETTSQKEATGQAEAVSEKVEQKIEQAKNKPKAYLGTITDIAENTIQIKSISGEILQVSLVLEETDFVKIGTTNQAVSYSDVAIGDFIIAMGFVDEKEVLDARRILLTSEPPPPDRRAVLGEITDVNTRKATLSPKGEEAIVIEPVRNVKITLSEDEEISTIRFSKIEEGSKTVAVGLFEKDILSARTIHVISVPEPSPTPTPRS